MSFAANAHKPRQQQSKKPIASLISIAFQEKKENPRKKNHLEVKLDRLTVSRSM